jgi:hypothetical protein
MERKMFEKKPDLNIFKVGRYTHVFRNWPILDQFFQNLGHEDGSGFAEGSLGQVLPVPLLDKGALHLVQETILKVFFSNKNGEKMNLLVLSTVHNNLVLFNTS